MPLCVLLSSSRSILVSYLFTLTMGDRDNLNENKGDFLFYEPLTSELDPVEMAMTSELDRAMSESHNDLGSCSGSEVDNTENK